MRLTVFAATFAFLLWGTHAFAGTAPDSDGDGIQDSLDNCSDAINSLQDDTDVDDCGNICDADYNNDGGKVGFGDFGLFVQNFLSNNEVYCHVEIIPGCTVGFDDYGQFIQLFGAPPGPSGTTTSTTACP